MTTHSSPQRCDVWFPPETQSPESASNTLRMTEEICSPTEHLIELIARTTQQSGDPRFLWVKVSSRRLTKAVKQEDTLIFFYYITCHLLDAFIQSDLHTQYCGQSPQEQFGVECLAQGHNDMLTAVHHTPHEKTYSYCFNINKAHCVLGYNCMYFCFRCFLL